MRLRMVLLQKMFETKNEFCEVAYRFENFQISNPDWTLATRTMTSKSAIFGVSGA